MTDADDEIVRKAQGVFSGLHPEQKRIRELEIMAALGSVLTEPEIARLIVLGLEALAVSKPEDDSEPPTVA